MTAVKIVGAAYLFVACAALGAAETDKKDSLENYLSDVTPGNVSAGTLVGLAESAISQIQTSQDLVVALKPFASKSSKTGFGVAITPARTTVTPMSGQAYKERPLMRLLGALTLSYAENSASISGTSYRKYGFSLDTYYYFQERYDPVLAGHNAFVACEKLKELRPELLEAAQTNDRARFDELTRQMEAAQKECVDDAHAKTPWNAHRVSLSFGAARIRPEDGAGGSESLGRSITLAGIYGLHEHGALYLSVRRSYREVDLTTLTTSPTFKSSTIAAVRYTYGSKEKDGDLKVLAEVSNAKKSEVTASNAVFKYAVGVDKKIAKGTWLEFRLGKNRTFDGTETQTTSLLTFNWQPSYGLFK